ncbi:MAG TPA: CPBP family intramembrane metalloprotease [Bacteroidetes bacterium]|nr:CPBP family intramembrane metalloprotease [Bacteroidota bacterium]
MINIVEKAKSSSLLSFILALAATVLVIELSDLIANPVSGFLKQHFELNFYTSNVISKFFMLLFSILAILLINGGRLKGFGFKMPSKFGYVRLILLTIGIALASFIFGSILFIVILNSVFPIDSIGGSTMGFPEQQSLLEIVLTVWIWSSLCEEVLTRGLLQGVIQHLYSKKFLRLSLPVWISGIFFGLMHTRLINGGMNFWFVAFIVFNTSIIGLLAAYYREKSGSIFPAFLVHVIANIVGFMPSLFVN